MKKHPKPVLVGMVGLVGSGKSTVAKEIAKHLKAEIIWQDGIRLAFRRRRGSYRTAEVDREADRLLGQVLREGRNAVDDGDAVSTRNQKRLARLAKRYGARLLFVRVICASDVVFGRIVSTPRADPYFAGASSLFRGSPKAKAIAVKLRELWHRTPLHYTWSIPRESSRWTLKLLPHRFTAMIDTSHEGWKRGIASIARVILKE